MVDRGIGAGSEYISFLNCQIAIRPAPIDDLLEARKAWKISQRRPFHPAHNSEITYTSTYKAIPRSTRNAHTMKSQNRELLVPVGCINRLQNRPALFVPRLKPDIPPAVRPGIENYHGGF